MPPTRRNKEGLLARVNFPLYSVQMLTSRHILVAGGGGSSKTGVANGFEIFELSHDSERYVAEEVIRHETGPSVVMNCATYSNGRRTYLVAGQESHCQLYNVVDSIISPDRESNNIETNTEEKDGAGEPRQRKKLVNKEGPDKKASNQKVNNNSNSYRQLMFEIKPNDSIQTDFSKDEPLQRVVRIGRNGKLMATAGTDGYIRLWTFPSLKKKLDIAAHSKEVDDLDISPNQALLVSISKDGLAILWDVATGKKINELKWNVPEDTKYLYKRCRFGIIEGDINKFRLFTLTNPVGRPAKLKSFLQMWIPEEACLKKCVPCPESLSALSVSDDGRFVAVGTMFSGSVSVYIAFSLQRVLHVQGAHSMFVTGLEFLPNVLDGSAINSATETAVVSISVDNRVCIHDLAYRSTSNDDAGSKIRIQVYLIPELWTRYTVSRRCSFWHPQNARLCISVAVHVQTLDRPVRAVVLFVLVTKLGAHLDFTSACHKRCRSSPLLQHGCLASSNPAFILSAS